MLQKLSKCEVKAWLCWNLMILPPLWFCMKKLYFGEFKWSIDGNFRDAKLWILVNLEHECCSNLLKNQNSEPLKLAKMTFLDSLISPKIDLTWDLIGGKVIRFQQNHALTTHFESFWSIVHWKAIFSITQNYISLELYVVNSHFPRLVTLLQQVCNSTLWLCKFGPIFVWHTLI